MTEIITDKTEVLIGEDQSGGYIFIPDLERFLKIWGVNSLEEFFTQIKSRPDQRQISDPTLIKNPRRY